MNKNDNNEYTKNDPTEYEEEVEVSESGNEYGNEIDLNKNSDKTHQNSSRRWIKIIFYRFYLNICFIKLNIILQILHFLIFICN